jgi:hypothetical protein
MLQSSLEQWLERATGAMRRIPLGLNIAILMDIETEWTPSGLLPKSSGLRASSRSQTPDLCTRTTSRLRIEDTTKGSRLAHGFGFGSGKGFAADLKLGCVRFEQNRPFHSNDPDGLRQWTAIDPS